MHPQTKLLSALLMFRNDRKSVRIDLGVTNTFLQVINFTNMESVNTED